MTQLTIPQWEIKRTCQVREVQRFETLKRAPWEFIICLALAAHMAIYINTQIFHHTRNIPGIHQMVSYLCVISVQIFSFVFR